MAKALRKGCLGNNRNVGRRKPRFSRPTPANLRTLTVVSTGGDGSGNQRRVLWARLGIFSAELSLRRSMPVILKLEKGVHETIYNVQAH